MCKRLYVIIMSMRKDKRELRDSEERISELEELYVQVRDDFVENYDEYKPHERTKIMQQLRGFWDDIAKEAGGRVKRQEINQTFGSRDQTFLELIAGVRGNLPQPKPVIEVMPYEAEQVNNEESGAGTESA